MAIANEISGIEDCVYSLTNKANIMKLSINDIVIQLFIPLQYKPRNIGYAISRYSVFCYSMTKTVY